MIPNLAKSQLWRGDINGPRTETPLIFLSCVNNFTTMKVLNSDYTQTGYALSGLNISIALSIMEWYQWHHPLWSLSGPQKPGPFPH